MAQINANDILKSSTGKVWYNGRQLANIKSLEAKIKGEYTDVKMCGELSTGHAFVGYDGSGDIVLHKINSDVASEIAENMKYGDMTGSYIITKITNNKGESERVRIDDVVFEEITLAQMSEKNLIEEKLPFKFSDFKYLDRIRG